MIKPGSLVRLKYNDYASDNSDNLGIVLEVFDSGFAHYQLLQFDNSER